jgi:hypothetical protein
MADAAVLAGLEQCWCKLPIGLASSAVRRVEMQVDTQLEVIYRHIREGLAGIEQQRSTIAELHGTGQATDIAERFLALLENVQICHEALLARLEPACFNEIPVLATA